ncbi:hypothetical protein E2C01_054067 [Portunus trituberculatus]|uniref:Uncharacterized protein n=1 Tax=Portunus trituberculatus TaxID=210409 RepID=A0A5B7GQX9_PORTR|nr:hypothetical protein [Portunus trituberculatus]
MTRSGPVHCSSPVFKSVNVPVVFEAFKPLRMALNPEGALRGSGRPARIGQGRKYEGSKSWWWTIVMRFLGAVLDVQKCSPSGVGEEGDPDRMKEE